MSGRVAALDAVQRGRPPDRLRRRGLRRRLEVGQRRHHLQARLRQAAGAVDRRRRRSTPRTRKTVWVGTGESLDAQQRLDRRRHLQVDRRRRQLDQRGPARDRAHRQDPRRPDAHPNTVYACAPGKLWSDSDERGVYKTTDGGKTWTKILKGAQPLHRLLDDVDGPPEPEDALRRHVGLPPQGLDVPLRRRRSRRAERQRPVQVAPTAAPPGPTLDDERRKGLPAEALGPRRGDRRAVEAERRLRLHRGGSAQERALPLRRRRHDLGRRRTAARTWSGGPFYFANLIVDPKNENSVYKPDGLAHRQRRRRQELQRHRRRRARRLPRRLDRPANTDHLIAGDDGGLWYSYDGGNKWWKAENLPVSQFYHVSVDMDRPYHVYGGLQDNSSWVGDSRVSRAASPTAAGRTCTAATASGCSPTPADPTTSTPRRRAARSAASTARRTRRATSSRCRATRRGSCASTGTRRSTSARRRRARLHRRAVPLPLARPRPDAGSASRPTSRPTIREKQKQEQSGGVTVDNSAAEMHTTIYAIAESPQGPERHLGRHRRRQPAGHARRRQDLDERRRQHRGTAEERLGVVGRGRPLRRRHRVRHVRPATPSAT